MSRLDNRLDDELRNAFRREEPSDDFTMRLLERVSLEPAPRLRWWQKLAMLLEPPKLGPKLSWIAVGVTASLLLAIGAVEYSRMEQAPADNNVQLAKENPSSSTSEQPAVSPGAGHTEQKAATDNPVPQSTQQSAPQSAQKLHHVASSSTSHRLARVRHQEERELRAEGEVAKEKLMLALSIASSALSDAQKAVHDDGLQP